MTSLPCALCIIWICLICHSTGTGFIYQFPGVTGQSVNSEQSATTGSPGSGSNIHLRNWCQYTVLRTVKCQVHNGTETMVQRVFQGCRWPGPCSKLISYRTVVRPSYKVAYRQITAREWRCCPGFVGDECREVCPRPSYPFMLLEKVCPRPSYPFMLLEKVCPRLSYPFMLLEEGWPYRGALQMGRQKTI
ncbi:unnamed protein product [Oncorhynchus mykiss]|uniref:EMI domain-containing protein n=1 Tax=Oncorhynchus mykiss TaxID=8022 RepID=A0A060Y5Z6_ONCMY|nr:unnamed protein product [Oncorhynchus mykiss]